MKCGSDKNVETCLLILERSRVVFQSIKPVTYDLNPLLLLPSMFQPFSVQEFLFCPQPVKVPSEVDLCMSVLGKPYQFHTLHYFNDKTPSIRGQKLRTTLSASCYVLPVLLAQLVGGCWSVLSIMAPARVCVFVCVTVTSLTSFLCCLFPCQILLSIYIITTEPALRTSGRC